MSRLSGDDVPTLRMPLVTMRELVEEARAKYRDISEELPQIDEEEECTVPQ